VLLLCGELVTSVFSVARKLEASLDHSSGAASTVFNDRIELRGV
jgi:hypothetical protein